MRRAIRDIYPIEDFAATQNKLLSSELHISPLQAGDLIQHWLGTELDSVYRRLRPYRHVRELITSLRDRGVKTAVLSDFPVANKLEYLGLQGLWDCIHSSEESGYLKPRREAFELLVDCLGESPGHIVYIGNNYEYDIVGANNVGLMTAYLSTKAGLKRKYSAIPTFEFTNYEALSKALFAFVR